MLDFLKVSTTTPKAGVVEIKPKFVVNNCSKDLMIRGQDFYAIWDEENNSWSTNEQDVVRLIDNELYAERDRVAKSCFQGTDIRVFAMWDSDSNQIDKWHKYCQKQSRDHFQMLDEKLIFSNTVTTKEDYSSKRLSYPLEAGDFSAYDELMSVLYSPEERQKIEWAIGAVVSGDSKNIQKFLVLYGAAGTGKSTVIGIIEKLFAGYYSTFDSKALGSASSSFALESFKTNPLVAIQHDGDLSHIEDNTRLNSLVSHELMTVNEKFRSAYTNRFKCFLFMGTNKPVKITDGKSGIIRRLIDVKPTGNKIPKNQYDILKHKIDFELGAIAVHCLEVYNAHKSAYDTYIPVGMMGASNDFYNFVLEYYSEFEKNDGVSLTTALKLFDEYKTRYNFDYKLNPRVFKEELKNYFKDYSDTKRGVDNDGNRHRRYYSGFRKEIFEQEFETVDQKIPGGDFLPKWLDFFIPTGSSPFDIFASEYPAQYANDDGNPLYKWTKVTTKLKDIDPKKLHYVNIPEDIWLIIVDFDLKNEAGEKDLKKNIEAASKWPETYAELSKSGSGIHLHYFYKGDPSKLSTIYDHDIEIKYYKGNSSLRRKLSKCNNYPIATLQDMLPKKEMNKTVSKEVVETEKTLIATIKKCLRKETDSPYTKPCIDMINNILDKAYESGVDYDVSNYKNDIIAFANQSSHNAEYCLKVAKNMKYRSKDLNPDTVDSKDIGFADMPIAFFDIEVFPNLCLVMWKIKGVDKCYRMFNPTADDIENLCRYRLIGFNCRKYDNHILWAIMMGYSNLQLYNLSQKLIGGDENAGWLEAKNLSYTDVLDFASAGHKQSLKKYEIELGIPHMELGLPWDQPVPEELWGKVADYCENDVNATEKTFDYLYSDWMARVILADLAGMTVNSTTNNITTKIIFGNNRHPQNEFCYRDLSKPVYELPFEVHQFLSEACPEMLSYPHGKDESLLPYFEGYKYENGVSTYRGEEVGEGGYVYAEPGIYFDVALLDITSMHPHSTIAECLFGPRFTKRFRDIVEGRVSIKHEDFEAIDEILDGKLKPHIAKIKEGLISSADLATALKTAINSVYGLTAAKFDNAFHDPRNIDNIVAKRGALFMVDLKNYVQSLGFTVAHIKTDSIKIPNATQDIIDKVQAFGKRYGYNFEHEATYDRMCIVNDAVYIAKYKDGKHAGEWTATGKQFQVPYVFKTLFSKEPLEFKDYCVTQSAQTALYLDLNETLPENEHNYTFIGKVGSFCPVKDGYGGGGLYRQQGDKYNNAAGAKGYKWIESEKAAELNYDETCVDTRYFTAMTDKAIEAVNKYGERIRLTYEQFVA